jgi:hypothetical protein
MNRTIYRTGIKCESCRMPVVLPFRDDVPTTPFCGCRFYRRTIRNAVIEVSPQLRVRIESPLWLVGDHDNFALLGEGLEIVKVRARLNGLQVRGVKVNGETVWGAKLVLPPS